jgi:hypothetical protein
VNDKTEEQSKEWMHIYSPNKRKKFKQTLCARQIINGNLFIGYGRMLEFMQATTVTSEMYFGTLKDLCQAIQKNGLVC